MLNDVLKVMIVDDEFLKKEDAKPVTLTLWHQWVVDTDAMTNPLKNAIKAWNDQNPKIQIQADGVNGEQYKPKIKTALAAGEAPDLFFAWGGSFVSPYVKSGNCLAIDDYLNDGTKDKLVEGTLGACTFDGKVYSLPTTTYIANLYCNKELFDKAGAKIPATYDELLDAVKALRAKGITPMVVGEKDRWPGMYWFDILAMRSAGNQACIDAMNKPSQFDQQAFKDAATKGKVTAVPFPLIKDGKGNAGEFFGGNVDGFYINANTKSKEEAVKVLKFISEQAGKEGYLSGAGLPCWKIAGLDDSKLPPLAKQSAQLMGTAKSFVGWWDTVLPAADAETHKNLIADLFAGKKTPDDFIKEMAKLKGASN